MNASFPVKLQEIAKLANNEVYGIDPRSLKFQVTCIESEKYISVADSSDAGDKNFTVIDMTVQNDFKVTKKPLKAENVLMHPNQNIISLKAKTDQGCMIQIFNMDSKQKLKTLNFNEIVQYWKWISLTKLALVTATSVYHTDITLPDNQQEKVFDRAGNLINNASQIIGYSCDTEEKWCALFGINSPDSGKTINGNIQLFLKEGSKQQLLQGHCCCFGKAYVHADDYLSSLFCYVDKKEGEQQAKVMFTEISNPKEGCQKYKKSCDINYSPEFQNDFPIMMHISQKFGVLFIITKFGFLYLFELTTGQNIFRTRISNDAVFVGCKKDSTDGVLVINKSGSLISLDVDPNSLIQHLITQCSFIQDVQTLAFTLASRYKLPGCDQMFVEQFNRLLMQGDVVNATKIAAQSPGTIIRNAETINKIKQIPNSGGPAPVLIYFQTLLDKGKLNQLESLELVKLVVSQNKAHVVDDWIRNDKLECSEELGDIMRTYNKETAVRIYERVRCIPKQIQVYLELGWQDKAQELSRSTGVSIDYMDMFRREIPYNPEGAYQTAKSLCQKDPNVNVHGIAQIFLESNKLKEMSQFLVDCMRNNRPEDGPWQEKVLEMNLLTNNINVVDLILSMDIWNQYNKYKIAVLCEQKGLLNRALENYTELKDIRRVILNTHMIPMEFLESYLNKMQADNIIVCLQDMLKHNRQNLQLAVKVTTTNYQRLNIANVIQMFESVGAFDGIYYFLGSIINNTTDKDIHFKYIQAAAKCSQVTQIEKIIREKKDCYDPAKVKDYLIEAKLPDPKPLIFLCDIHGEIEELTKYLYQNNFTKFIEIYLFRVNQNATPQVVGTLIDLECDELYIKKLLYNIRGNCPIEQLIAEFEKRNKLRVLENWLDGRVAEGNQLPSIHNALAKIKIDTNASPEDFLLNNQFYDSKVVGKYCEERDPHLAYQAYKRAWGNCDMELIEVTNKNALYRLQARYLVERQSLELWQHVLTPDNPHRKAIIEQVVSAALPDSKSAEEVSCTVQAFMVAELPNELISLLEKIVLHNSDFGSFKKLQNLLIITAIKSDKTRVMDYIKRLDNYDGEEIAKIALGEQYQLYEEAFVIFQKQNLNVQAIEVLLNNIENIQRAQEFADKVNQSEVFSRLAHAYLDKYQVVEAIDCYIKAKDASNYSLVIQAAESENKFEQLIKFLLMAREVVKDATIDNALSFAYSKLDKIPELEELIMNPNSIDFGRVGDRCFGEKLYEAARILYNHIKNNAKIASCLVHLKQFQKAIESAKKANTPKTWKELCIACVEAEEFKLAAVAGMNIIIHPDHLEDLMKQYEAVGAQEEMISLLQQGMTQERAHIGIYTELGILYAKYQPQYLMEHIKQYFQKLNVSKLLRTCERFKHWPEAVYLYQNYQEFDNAINVMIEHSPSAFNHDLFINLIQKVSNHELYYKAILFYYEQQPLQINQLLKALQNKIDLTKTITVMRKTGDIALIQGFLKEVQSVNNQAVNETLNQIYLDSENHEELRKSIELYDNFEPINLAKFTENHELIEFRRVAAFLYRKTQKFEFSIEISKKDKQYRDCVETAQESGSYEIVENLLKFFVINGEKEFFSIILFTCYDLLHADIVMELSWRFGLMDYAMPYFINILKELTAKIETVQKKHEQKEKQEEKKEKQQATEILDVGANHLLQLGSIPMIAMDMSMQGGNIMGGMMPMNQPMGGFQGGFDQNQMMFQQQPQGFQQQGFNQFGQQY